MYSTSRNNHFRIIPENSAPSQGRPAQSVLWASDLLRRSGIRRVVDIGCGRFRNLTPLLNHFKQVTLVETKFQIGRISSLLPSRKNLDLLSWEDFLISENEYEAAFLISVLHILPWPKQRHALLNVATQKLVPKGYLVIDVPCAERYYRQHCTPDRRFSDGWLMGNGNSRTFYRNYGAHELDTMVKKRRPLYMAYRKNINKHIVRIWRKT